MWWTSLTKFARENDNLREEDLKKLYDSQLSQLGQIGVFIVGAVFGGILTGAVSEGFKWLNTFNLFIQPIQESIVIWIVAIGLVIGMLFAFSASGKITLRFKIALTKDYLEARTIVTGRTH